MATAKGKGGRGNKARAKAAPVVEQKEPSFLEKVQTAPARFRKYVESLRTEMRLVTWPSRDQVQTTTLVVLVTVVIFAVFFGVVDYLLATGQTWLYGQFQ